jgi:hypothetical protein
VAVSSVCFPSLCGALWQRALLGYRAPCSVEQQRKHRSFLTSSSPDKVLEGQQESVLQRRGGDKEPGPGEKPILQVVYAAHCDSDETCPLVVTIQRPDQSGQSSLVGIPICQQAFLTGHCVPAELAVVVRHADSGDCSVLLVRYSNTQVPS